MAYMNILMADVTDGSEDAWLQFVAMDDGTQREILRAYQGYLGVLGVSTEAVGLEVGVGRTGDGLSHIDLVGDATYADYGLRIIRNGGVNASTQFVHRGTGEMLLYAQEAASIAGYTNSIKRYEVKSDGVFDLVSGQLKFPATQNASADANTLDDYKEGLFTPTINFGGGSTGIVYGDQNGYYTKVGRLIFCKGRVRTTLKGSSTGTATLEGLPYSVAHIVSQAVSSINSGLTGLNSMLGGYGTGTQIVLTHSNGSGTGTIAITDTEFTDTVDIYFSITYLTS
jgi:hypothetical protein